MKKKKNKWIKARHGIITNIAYIVLYPYARLRYGIEIERFKNNDKRNFLILLNHQTPFDQFFVGMTFKMPIYYLATEDIFSNGFISSVIRFLVAPIPIKKQTTDVTAVMNCIRVVKEGGTIAIAPEGNRTYSGRTEYMNPAIVTLAKKLKLPIVLYRIEGGYGSEPRWSDCIRKGKMRSYIHKIIEPEEYKDISNEELLSIIEKGLYVDEAIADGIFKSNKRAEYLERAMYVCPFCGLSEFESHGNEIKCKKCGIKVTYGLDKKLRGIGFNFPFNFVAEWYDYQKDFINNLMITEFNDTVMYADKVTVSEVIINKRKILLAKDSDVLLYGNKIIINDKVFPFNSLSAVTVLGKNKLNIYFDGKVYQLKGSKRFNALKYVNIYYRYKNIVKGEENGKFLGL